MSGDDVGEVRGNKDREIEEVCFSKEKQGK